MIKPALFFTVLLCFLSCNKQRNEAQVDFCREGYIYWGGAYAVDGIGWYFAESRSGSWLAMQLKEEELPAAYKTNPSDSIAVLMCLKKTEERAPCFCSVPGYFYKIISIQKK